MDLLTQLEEKINLTLENYELLYLEIDELKEHVKSLTTENSLLSDQQVQWENKVKSLLSVFTDNEAGENESSQDQNETDVDEEAEQEEENISS